MMGIWQFKLGDIVQYNQYAHSVLRGWGLDKYIEGTGKVYGFANTDKDEFLMVKWGDEQRIIHPIHLEKVADNEK